MDFDWYYWTLAHEHNPEFWILSSIQGFRVWDSIFKVNIMQMHNKMFLLVDRD